MSRMISNRFRKILHHTKTTEMKKNTTLSAFLITNCTIVEAGADIQTIRFIFSHFPNRFLPVVRGLRFIGIILREDFEKNYMQAELNMYSAKDLISKEIVKLATYNTLGQAKEVFDTKVFDVIPVTDEVGDLRGILLREDVEKALLPTMHIVHSTLEDIRKSITA